MPKENFCQLQFRQLLGHDFRLNGALVSNHTEIHVALRFHMERTEIMLLIFSNLLI